MSALRLLSLLIGLAPALTACGMKGDLYLEDGAAAAEVAPSAAPAVPTPGTTETPPTEPAVPAPEPAAPDQAPAGAR